MIVTEEEAFNLQCRVGSASAGSDGLMDFTCCVGASCMHWKWENHTEQKFHAASDRRATVEPDRPNDLPDSWQWLPYGKLYSGLVGENAGWVEPIEEAMLRRKGRCGLGG